MSEPYANPFRSWAELARGLREAYVSEMVLDSERAKQLPRGVELVNAVNAIARTCESAAGMLDRLDDYEPEAFAAFNRALARIK